MNKIIDELTAKLNSATEWTAEDVTEEYKQIHAEEIDSEMEPWPENRKVYSVDREVESRSELNNFTVFIDDGVVVGVSYGSDKLGLDLDADKVDKISSAQDIIDMAQF